MERRICDFHYSAIRDLYLRFAKIIDRAFLRMKQEQFSGEKLLRTSRARCVRVVADLSIHRELLINGRSSPRPRVSFVDNVTQVWSFASIVIPLEEEKGFYFFSPYNYGMYARFRDLRQPNDPRERFMSRQCMMPLGIMLPRGRLARVLMTLKLSDEPNRYCVIWMKRSEFFLLFLEVHSARVMSEDIRAFV